MVRIKDGLANHHIIPRTKKKVYKLHICFYGQILAFMTMSICVSVIYKNFHLIIYLF